MSTVTGTSILGNTLLDLLSTTGPEVATLGSACNASYVRFYNHNNVSDTSWTVGLASSNAFAITRSNAATVVGIGTTAPVVTSGLDVNGDINFSGTLKQGGSAYLSSQWTSTTLATGSNAIYYACNVGVGTAAPQRALSVVGDIGFTGNLYQNGTLFVGGGGSSGGVGACNMGTDFSYISVYGSATDGTKTFTTNSTNTDVRTLYSFQLKAGRYLLNANIPFTNLTNAVTMDNLNWATVGIYTSPYVDGATPLAFTSIRINTTTDLITQPFECVLEVAATATYVVVVSGKGHTLRFGSSTVDSRLRVVPIAGLGFNDAYDVSAALQVTPVRATFKPTTTTAAFTATAAGYYTATSSNVDVYRNGNKLVYVSSTVKDYDVVVGYTYSNGTSTVTASTWTITLQTAAVSGDVIDITVYPQATATTQFNTGYLYQDITLNPTPWNLLTDNSGIRFSGNRVVIDGDLVVGGNVLGGSNTAGYVIGTRYDITGITGAGGTGVAVQWQTAYPAPTFDLPTGGVWTMSSNVGSYRYAGNEIVYNMNATATVTTQPNLVAWGCNVATYAGCNVGISVPFPVNTAQYYDGSVLGDLLLTLTNAGGTFVNTFPAYARVDAANANHVVVRYVTGTTDNSMVTLGVGATVKLQGTITYATTQMTGGVPTAFLPPQFAQDALGRLAVNATGAQPRAMLDVTAAAATSNLPAFVADQQGGVAGVDTMQIRVAGTSKLVVDYAGKVGVGTTTPAATLDVAGDIRMTGVMRDSNLNSIWIPGSTVQWLAVTPDPAIGGTGLQFLINSTKGYYRYVGNEVVYQINVSGSVTAQPALSVDYTLTVPQSAPVDTPAGSAGASARYQTNTIVGELWLSVINGTSSNTFKAYARTSTTSATTLTLRYVTGTTDDTLAKITAGSTVTLQGTIAYASPLLNNVNGMPLTLLPATFVQDAVGKVGVNSLGNAPRGQLDVVCTSNVPALIADQRGAADAFQVRSNATPVVVVSSAGNVGIGSTAPAATLDVAGSINTSSALTASTITTTGNVTLGGYLIAYPKMTIIQDQKASGTGAGASAVGWQQRTLNTFVVNGLNLTLTTNSFTLAAGTYHVVASAPAYKADRHRIRLSTTSTSTPALLGTGEYAFSTGGVQTRSFIDDVLVLSTSTALGVWHNMATADATYGLGVNTTLGTEIYTTVRITQIA